MSLKARIRAWLGFDAHSAEVEALRGQVRDMAKGFDEKIAALTQAAAKSDAKVLGAALDAAAEMVAASQKGNEALMEYVKEVTDIVSAGNSTEVN